MSDDDLAMSARFPAWARDELTALARRYGEPLIGVNRDPDAAAYLRTIKTQRRPGEVCMVVRRPSGALLVSRKTFYPPGSFRLPTGGVHRGESILSALLRETEEETNLSVRVRRFLAVARYQPPDAPTPVNYATFAFLLDELAGTLQSNDPHELLEAYREITPEALPEVADQLDSLADNPSDEMEASYRAWGRFRAPTHRLAWQALNTEPAP